MVASAQSVSRSIPLSWKLRRRLLVRPPHDAPPHLPLYSSLPFQLFSALVLVLPPTYSDALDFLGWHPTISRTLAVTGVPVLVPVRRVSRGEVGSVVPLR
ncbi:hypothetical protein C8R45DRAFT_1103240 [Mycena sanguinolenta]|nr:hypothetical protein C8R45DRAFT_1103240 [Mycena sanguinolenta]